MSTIINSVKLKNGKTLEIHQDENPESPRTWDNLGILAVFHKRYDFGDTVDFKSDQFSSWDEMENHIVETYKPLAILPVYMYDHGGITINTTGFSCGWDSGQVGFIYVTQKSIDLLGSYIKDDESYSEYKERLEEHLRNEIETLDQYLTGDVYGFIIKDESDNEEDSCWGFFGDDIKTNGILDHIDKDLIEDLSQL